MKDDPGARSEGANVGGGEGRGKVNGGCGAWWADVACNGAWKWNTGAGDCELGWQADGVGSGNGAETGGGGLSAELAVAPAVASPAWRAAGRAAARPLREKATRAGFVGVRRGNKVGVRRESGAFSEWWEGTFGLRRRGRRPPPGRAPPPRPPPGGNARRIVSIIELKSSINQLFRPIDFRSHRNNYYDEIESF